LETNYNYVFELVKVMSKVLSVFFSGHASSRGEMSTEWEKRPVSEWAEEPESHCNNFVYMLH